jgi:hypothetical protein
MIEKIERSVKEVRDKAFYDASILKSTFGWDQNADVRVTAIGKIIRLLVALQLGLNSMRRLELANDDQWTTLLLPAGENKEHAPYLGVLELVTKSGFVSSLFSAMESSLRVLLVHIDPEGYARLRLKTRKLFQLLLLEKLSHPYESEFTIIDLLRNLRNTLHSNGVFHPPDSQPVTFTYRGRTLAFEPEKRVDFADWGLIVSLADDMRQICFRIARDPVISGASSIPDPWRVL